MPAPPRAGLSAFGVSLLLHGVVVIAVTRGNRVLPPVQRQDVGSALKGSTFDMELSRDPASEAGGAAFPGAPARPSEQTPSAAASEPTRVNGAGPLPAQRAKPQSATHKASRDLAPPSDPVQEEPTSPSGDAGVGAPNFGAAGSPEGRLSLLRSFIKTLPLAAKLLPGWLEADLGPLAPVLAELHVSREGELVDVQILKGDRSHLVSQSVRKNQVFLRAGRFVGASRLVVAIKGTVSMKASLEEAEAAEKVVAIGQRSDPSRPGAPPTGAYFTFGSGRHVEFAVEEIPGP